MAAVFRRLKDSAFNLRFRYLANAILLEDFPEAAEGLDSIISEISIPIEEIIAGGGGEAQSTQRLRRTLHEAGWAKGSFRVEKKINDPTTFSQSREVDHVKNFPRGTIALEIEWNNKDPFFDRDLENVNRLHGDGAISVGIIVTRGDSLQEGVEGKIKNFAVTRHLGSF